MKYCVYQYQDVRGKRCFGCQKAASVFECYQHLEASHISPLKLYAMPLPKSTAPRRLKNVFLIFFFRQLAMALESGVPLLEALHYMGQEQANKQQEQFVQRMAEGVLAGLSFSKMLLKTGQVAPFFVQWVRIGEKQGNLPQVLREISAYLAKQEESRKKIVGQLVYPAMVLCAIGMVALLLFFVVLPILAQQFIGMETPLPWMLRVPLLVHDWLSANRMLLLIAVIGLGAWLAWYFRSASHQNKWKHKVSCIGMKYRLTRQLLVLSAYVPFARLLGQLLASGIPVQEGLRELERYFAHHLFASEIGVIQEKMTKGVPLSQAMIDAPFVPDMARQMIHYSEKVGRLPETLGQSALYYETVIVDTLALWIKCIEPVAILFLGVMVLLIALGLFVPILESYQLVLHQ